MSVKNRCVIIQIEIRSYFMHCCLSRSLPRNVSAYVNFYPVTFCFWQNDLRLKKKKNLFLWCFLCFPQEDTDAACVSVLALCESSTSLKICLRCQINIPLMISSKWPASHAVPVLLWLVTPLWATSEWNCMSWMTRCTFLSVRAIWTWLFSDRCFSACSSSHRKCRCAAYQWKSSLAACLMVTLQWPLMFALSFPLPAFA